MELTFGEQIKIILKRKNMTIRQLAETIEEQTGRPMSRQNLTQKLNRDNFQEQDMREIAQALGCVIQISVIDPMEATVASLQSMMQPANARDMFQEGRAGAGEALSHEKTVQRDEQGEIAEGVSEEAFPEMPALLKAGDGDESAGAESVSAVGENAEEGAVDPDVLREIEMALMESIQKELYPLKDGETTRVNQEWQEQANSHWSRKQKELEEQTSLDKEENEQTEQVRNVPEEIDTSAVSDVSPEPEMQTDGTAAEGKEIPEEPVVQENDMDEEDALAWAQKRPAKWPRLIVPGESGEGHQQPEASAYEEDEPEFVETEDDLDGLEFIEMEELDGGDISAVTGPYTLKREQEPEAEDQRDSAAQEELLTEGTAYGPLAGAPGTDVSYVSAPYVIPRAPESEESVSDNGDGENSMYFEIPLEEIPEPSIDDREETVQDYGGQPEEPDLEEKIASWDAAVKRRLERPILMSAEERRARKAAREAKSAGAENAVPEGASKPRVPDINPATGKEYETNTVKHHPTKPDMLLVYDKDEHMWIEQAEHAFTNFQIRKRAMLGRDYEPPLYLD
ncbi:hypothetical protein [Qiania dongpingensis]|uniref:Uncharacterized protein n=1 Tax=Qiania dongpingensis TaxID=2763669 RepID=A0A7G9G0W3_9FIRM|nr:hypothetical protein [Qiania dongpingensis]QNM04445.1 hypothetical protein H9Q78_08060 [Qiania dongpingensis]